MSHTIQKLDVDTITVTIHGANGSKTEATCIATEHGVYMPEFKNYNPDTDSVIHSIAVSYFKDQEKYQLQEDHPKNLRRAATNSNLSYEDYVLMTSAKFEKPALITC